MHGSDIGALNIYVNSSGSARRLAWKLSGEQGNNWFNGQVNVASVSGTYTVSIYSIDMYYTTIREYTQL